MRPLLVSLALLLLALCRPSSAGVYDHIPEDKMKGIQRDAYMLDLMVAAESVLSGTPVEQLEKVATAGPEAMKALSNGVLCALDPIEGLKPWKVKDLLYGGTTPDETALATTQLGITCPSDVNTITDEIAKCFCKDNHVLVYCGALKYKSEKLKDAVQPTKCLTEAIAEIQQYYWTARYKEIKHMAMHEFAKTIFKQFFDRNATVLSVVANKAKPEVFCAARNTSIDAQMRTLYTLTLSYYTVEDALEKEIFEEVGRKEGCSTDVEFKASPIGQCMCAFEKGIVLCTLRVMSQILEETGSLNCETVKFDETKVPTSIPRMLPRKITTTTSTSAPTTSGGSKGDSNSEDKTGGAATSSLLLATLAAAAAMLLRH